MKVGGRHVVLASASPDKAGEMATILRAVLGDDLVVVPRPDGVPEVIENGETLEDNARLKARAIAEAAEAAAGIVVADDTGLEVDALGGAPGVRSARFAGEGATDRDNVIMLLDALAERPEPGERSARFRTVTVAILPGGDEVVAEGTIDGTIALAPRGEHGFGYDGVFVPDEGDGRTFAEMAPADKHAVSHRGRALRVLADSLRRRGVGSERQ